jgi:Fic family protein
MEFFLAGVKETAEHAVSAARRILALLDTDRQKIEALGRPAATVLRVFLHAQTNPILSIQATAQKVGFSFPTVNASVHQLQTLGVLREITGKQRRRLFMYEDYLKILNEGTEPLR